MLVLKLFKIFVNGFIFFAKYSEVCNFPDIALEIGNAFIDDVSCVKQSVLNNGLEFNYSKTT